LHISGKRLKCSCTFAVLHVRSLARSQLGKRISVHCNSVFVCEFSPTCLGLCTFKVLWFGDLFKSGLVLNGVKYSVKLWITCCKLLF
jgi:hypothetical protein